MKKSVRKSSYARLLSDITTLYQQAQRALVVSYWQIGQRIVEQEQQGQATADYGAQLLARLSADLLDRLGSGFSVRNLRNMRRFYLEHQNRQAPAELTWSQHVELMPIRDPTERSKLVPEVFP